MLGLAMLAAEAGSSCGGRVAPGEGDPGLLDFVEGSLDHLGDPARDGTKDDEAVRAIARRMLDGARRQGMD